MMKRRIISVFILLVLLATIAVPAQGASARGVDRSKIKILSSQRYPAILTMGELSFEGVLARQSQITEEDIEKAIKEALKKYNKTEAEIGEAEALVEKVARDEVFTAEDSKRVGKEIRDFIGKQTGTYILMEVIEHILELNDRPLDEFILDTAVGAAQDKAVDLLLGELGGPVTDIVEGLMFLSEKHEQDKQKWKDRAEAIDAKRMLQNFYSHANYRLHHIAQGKPQGWRVSINATDSRYFTFFGIPGNLEIWTITMSLDKKDKGNDKEPKGQYNGFVDIEVKYEMSKFDEGIQNKYQDWIDGLYNELDQEMGFKWAYKNGGSPTQIYRHLSEPDDYNLYIADMKQKISLNFDGIDDYKIIGIDRQIERSVNQVHDNVHVQAKSIMSFKADNKEELLYSYEPQYFNLTVDGFGAAIPENKVTGEVPWDESLWEYWENDKVLEFVLPKQ